MKSIKFLILMLFLFFSSFTLSAQPVGPPDPPDSHGGSGDQNPGGNASIQGGLLLLLCLSAVYGSARMLKKDEPDID